MDFTSGSRKRPEKPRENAKVQSRHLPARIIRAAFPRRDARFLALRRDPGSIPASRTIRVLFMRVRSYTRRSNKPVAHEVNQCTRVLSGRRDGGGRIDFGVGLKLLDPERRRNQFPLMAKVQSAAISFARCRKRNPNRMALPWQCDPPGRDPSRGSFRYAR